MITPAHVQANVIDIGNRASALPPTLVADANILYWIFYANFATLAGGSLVGSFHLSQGALLLRIAIATGYVAFGFTALLALGVLFSILTDTAASAIGATVGVYIVSEILDGITQLGRVRYLFPTHYFAAWETMFTDNRYAHDMVVGIVSQLVYLVVFGTLAIVWFRRKDIRS